LPEEVIVSSDLVRSEPRISLNKLGEYMVATPRRRRRIIIEQKRPPDFQTARYTEAQDAIASFLATGCNNDEVILEAIRRLGASLPRTEWDAQRIQLCTEAIEAFMDFDDFSLLEEMAVSRGMSDPPKLQIGGVGVSVRPDVTLQGSDRSGAPVLGAVKLYIGKTIPLDAQSGAFVATTLHQYVDQLLEPEGAAAYRKCIVLDVFAGEMYEAPRAFQRRREDIEAACEEIARAWPAF
jgi:hypothetical protein